MVGAAQAAAQKNGVLNKGGRPPTDLGVLIEALFYRLRVDGPWRDLDGGFGAWQTIYGWYRRLARSGMWARLLERVAKKSRNKKRLVDGSHVKVHQYAANPAGGAQAQAMGKTRGGRNTKIMAATDGNGLPMRLELVSGQAYEGNHGISLLGNPRGLTVVGDKGFYSDKLRKELEALGPSIAFQANPTARRSASSTSGSTASAIAWRTFSAD